MKALNDRVIVKRDEAEKQSKGGIVLPDVAKKESRFGTVVAAGPGRMLDSGERAEMPVKYGDRVLFGAYAGNEVEIEGQKYTVLSEDEILATFEE